ncbi:MAG: helix-turn-helix domain-containing protein [Streptosporangiales bacterium]|nr:helix-turn-helix domain-containing protein [Streptosporangiales bacterium]
MSAAPSHVAYESDIAPIAALISDRTRAAMLTALLDGRALAAGELARLAGVSPATASSHLARLLDGRLITMEAQGRHRYYRLAGSEVARVLETIALISPPIQVRSLRQSRQAAMLRTARTCYDHLAGRAGVALLDALLDKGVLIPAGETYEVPADGEELLAGFGVDVPAVRRSRRKFAGPCLDWTERRPHLNGALGAALTARLIDLGWLVRGRERRALVITDTGRAGLADVFGCLLD